MNIRSHSTDSLPASARADHWNAVIARAYFPLDLTFRNAASFQGTLDMKDAGDVSLSRLRTEAVQYERHRHHIAAASEEQYLITIPRQSPVEFRQLGREVRCDPGGFILERGDEPYRFSYGAANDLCVLKIDKPLLAERLRNPDLFCAHVINGREGIGSLFTTMAQQVQRTGAEDPASGRVLGRHLIELLALALDRGADIEQGAGSSVRAAHRRRAEEVIRRNLAQGTLSPETVAEGCGISKRYLHELFSDVNCTVSQFIREQRLLAARDLLLMPNPGPMSDVAYRFGFSDQAQFSRLFKAKFGQTPSGFRAEALVRAAGD
ncbi:MAG: helix-turn-helix domain-containing protein [Pseudotabrizicola sp.]|uniref:AraC-like ligand-binding domain-containing protein n=1 Tax=Pseudotabrizicola sp. TaxID=2939647 RepID=UPI002728661A|nr:helix-turn-helix domain-containing protein [Pseudotabrizicola sp.]MDO8882067.1 helix-turn-helix domain-containing protein [Pseudotabrizicola sp.]MDP2083057.1 helix-turn-helix domain-containing protein [Pseudotabrizicola sp.]MDZ7572475.1 helix-turn-helix domain-containing protein [Pseudotabrizicola sp.]